MCESNELPGVTVMGDDWPTAKPETIKTRRKASKVSRDMGTPMAAISSMIRQFGRIFNLFSSHSVRCQTAEKRAIFPAFRPRVEKQTLPQITLIYTDKKSSMEPF
jgi:hypothetical protein